MTANARSVSAARLVPALEAIAGIAVLSGMDAIIKDVAARYPTFEVAFLRFAAGSLAVMLLVAILRPGWPSRETLTVNGARAFLVVMTACCFFYALGTLPLAETLALSFLSPVFMALFGALILREAVDRRIVVALGAGFLGMMVIVFGAAGTREYGDTALLGAAAAVVSALSYALAMVLLRARAGKDALVVIVAVQNVVPAVILLAPASYVWSAPAASDWPLFGVIGAMGVAGHLLLARAFAKAEAARLAPLEYTGLIWAVVLGYLFFAEIPTPTTLLGAGLIVAGAIAATRR